MSILNENLNQNLPTIQEQQANIIANNLKNNAKFTFKTLCDKFDMTTRMFWDNPVVSPQEIATALGTDAKEIFLMHYALGQLLLSIKSDAIQQSLALIGQFTINEDGTVTING